MITKATFNLEAHIKAIKCLSALVIKFTFYHSLLNCTLTFSRNPWGTLRAGGPACLGRDSLLLHLPRGSLTWLLWGHMGRVAAKWHRGGDIPEDIKALGCLN